MIDIQTNKKMDLARSVRWWREHGKAVGAGRTQRRAVLQAERCTPESTAGRSLLIRGKGRSVRAPVPSAEGLARSREEKQSRRGRETPQNALRMALTC